MVDNYKILGIDRNAPILEIKKAYRSLVKKYHPDKNQNGEKRFLEIKEAYENLMNPTVPRIFGIFECWEDVINVDDFDIPPVDYVELRKAEKERDELYKVFDTIGRTEWKKIDAKYRKKTLYFGNDPNYIKETCNVQSWINYNNAVQKCNKIKYSRLKPFYWASNKIKLLGKLYSKLYQLNDTDMKKIIKQFSRVLNGEVDIKEKIIPKPPKKPNRFLDYDKYIKFLTKKLLFDIQNQFHPKFLNKLPMKVQIFIHNKMRELIVFL